MSGGRRTRDRDPLSGMRKSHIALDVDGFDARMAFHHAFCPA